MEKAKPRHVNCRVDKKTMTQKEEKLYNHYANTARFYDLDFIQRPHEDETFYLNLIKPYKGAVLELCCGTGRISLFLAKNNIKVVGLDISDNMLDIFRTKLNMTSRDIQDKIKILKSDMVDFSINQKFKCIVIPLHSFQSLTDDTSISDALKNIHSHLESKGVFILNIFKPLDQMKSREGEYEEKIIADEEGNFLFKKTSLNTFVDTEKQILSFELKYDDGHSSIFDYFKIKYYYLHQILSLLKENNFNILSIYHGFDPKFSNLLSSELTLVSNKL